MMNRLLIIVAIIFMSLMLITACRSTPSPPKNSNDICEVFKEYPRWYWVAQATNRTWYVPISVQMAIIHQESDFRADASPANKKWFGLSIWHSSSAVGYAQALDETWRLYVKTVGKISANREDFSDADDFIGWYANRAHHELHIPQRDARAIYLVYHEGFEGYRHRSYRHKRWLLRVSKKVQQQAVRYRVQLQRCEVNLPKQPKGWLENIMYFVHHGFF